ncbi:hypothetical protein NP233_g7182 [Leucocoprinus birnbaumii]|uniref:ASTRA-associated protein 1 n=1 Tax=Leucocoprinus birnbaumii TaxID=56174 RepID=A0AAD5VSC7_9AGAR|nr:hypothetical protein NP233_g7182 [Leucocoprinus birnbaumii]
MSVPPPAAPSHLLRLHSHPINTLAFSPDNERIYSGDSSGLVVVTSSRSLRAISKWEAHSSGLLGIEEWEDQIITYAGNIYSREYYILIPGDNGRITELPEAARLGDTAARLDLPVPKLSYSLDVNALNYCRFSLTRHPAAPTGEKKALIAVPGLIDSSVADIWRLPCRNRIHAAIGQEVHKDIFSTDLKGRNSAGIIMGLHLFSSPMESDEIHRLHLLCAYENGSVTLRRFSSTDQHTSVEGVGWEVLWTAKLHAETIMAMKVSRQNDFAISVSADHLVCRYDVGVSNSISTPQNTGVSFKTKHPGNSSIAIRDDGKVCAIGGWDGSIRLYSTRTFKSLGTLKYHKSTCQAVEFARSSGCDHLESQSESGIVSDDEMSSEEKAERDRWLLGGGKDGRISIWSLIQFSKS